VVLIASVGSLTYGYNISILGNALSKPAFYEYLNLPLTGDGAGRTQALIAAWNCLLYVGGMIGCLAYPWISNNYGRKFPIFLSAVAVIVGGGLQAGTINSGMLCAARTIQGLSNGLILSGVPLYQAEVAPAKSRGLMVGLHGSFVLLHSKDDILNMHKLLCWGMGRCLLSGWVWRSSMLGARLVGESLSQLTASRLVSS
jgi:MFS family permease